MASAAAVQLKLTGLITEALQDTPEKDLVDLLDFIEVQFSGSSFNPDNLGRADAISQFLRERPFAATERGVDALACLASFALGKSEELTRSLGPTGRAAAPEQQLWLLASSALNTAAAIRESGADQPAAAFAWIERRRDVRSKYLQRDFAMAAVRAARVERPLQVHSASVQQGNSRPGKRDGANQSNAGGARAFATPLGLMLAFVVLCLSALVAFWLAGVGTYPVTPERTPTRNPMPMDASLRNGAGLNEGMGGA
jgi:hypothetical protein